MKLIYNVMFKTPKSTWSCLSNNIAPSYNISISSPYFFCPRYLKQHTHVSTRKHSHVYNYSDKTTYRLIKKLHVI